MIIRPVYNILLLPDVSYYFKKDFFYDCCTEPIEVGTDILFIQLKEEREEGTLAADSFYPIGVSARVEGISEGDNIQVRTMERVDISDIEIQDGVLTATASIRPEEADLTAEEEKELFGPDWPTPWRAGKLFSRFGRRPFSLPAVSETRPPCSAPPPLGKPVPPSGRAGSRKSAR